MQVLEQLREVARKLNEEYKLGLEEIAVSEGDNKTSSTNFVPTFLFYNGLENSIRWNAVVVGFLKNSGDPPAYALWHAIYSTSKGILSFSSPVVPTPSALLTYMIAIHLIKKLGHKYGLIIRPCLPHYSEIHLLPYGFEDLGRSETLHLRVVDGDVVISPEEYNNFLRQVMADGGQEKGTN